LLCWWGRGSRAYKFDKTINQDNENSWKNQINKWLVLLIFKFKIKNTKSYTCEKCENTRQKKGPPFAIFKTLFFFGRISGSRVVRHHIVFITGRPHIRWVWIHFLNFNVKLLLLQSRANYHTIVLFMSLFFGIELF
jgi:hypothetical protein